MKFFTFIMSLVLVSAVAFAEAQKKDSNRRTQVRSFARMNDHCTTPKDVKWVVMADTNWEIDTSKIKVDISSISKKSSFEGITFASVDSFVMKGRVVNSGSCFWPFKDARGSLKISVKWEENQNKHSNSHKQEI